MSEKPFEAELTIKDRLNYPYYLGDAILTRNRSILKEFFSESEIIEATENLLGLIPEAWKDEKFKEDLKAAIVKRKIDIRPEFCGAKASEEFCKEHGINMYVEEEDYEYRKLFSACINLLDRRGLTARRKFTERMTGNPYEDGAEVTNSEAEEL